MTQILPKDLFFLSLAEINECLLKGSEIDSTHYLILTREMIINYTLKLTSSTASLLQNAMLCSLDSFLGSLTLGLGICCKSLTVTDCLLDFFLMYIKLENTANKGQMAAGSFSHP